MANDPDRLTHDEAMNRVKEAGRQSALWGAPSNLNPYDRAPSMTAERAAWSAGHSIGASERRAGKRA